MPSDKWIKKILLNLFSLSTSSNPNEAALAAKKAADLLIKYNLDEASIRQELEPDDIRRFIVERHGRIISYRGYLLNSCAKVNSCVYMWLGSRNNWRLVLTGDKGDCRRAAYLYRCIMAQVEMITRNHWEERKRYTNPNLNRDLDFFLRRKYGPKPISSRKYLSSFRLGCISTICQAIEQQLTNPTSSPSNTQALMIIKDRITIIEQRIEKWYKLEKEEEKPDVDIEAYIAGKREGSKVVVKPTKELEG